MSAVVVTYVVASIGAVLFFLLVVFLAWLLYKHRANKQAADRVKHKPIVHPPSFRVPFQYKVIDAQTPVCETIQEDDSFQPFSHARGRRYAGAGIPKFNRPDSKLLTSKREAELEMLDKARKRSASEEIASNITGLSDMLKKRLSLPKGFDKDSSPSASVASFSSTEVDHEVWNSKDRQRKISVTVFQHLKTEGKRLSQSQPELLNEGESGVLTAAMRAADQQTSRSTLELPHPSAVVSGTSDDNEDVTAKSDIGPPPRERKRVAARRGQKQSKSYKAGKICFTTVYKQEEKALHVTVLWAYDVGKRKDRNHVNPFVRLYLIPGKKQKQHTRAQKRTNEPKFNELKIFYDLTQDDLRYHRLKFKVYSRESVKSNQLLGETDLALGTLNITKTEKFNLDLFMTVTDYAQIMISLLHDATKSQLKVIIHKAKDIPKQNTIGLPDTYCRIMLFRENEVEKKETKIKRNTRNPVWDESHELNVLTDIANPLSMMSLVVSLVSHSLMGKDEIIGHVIFSLDSAQKEALEHWETVQKSPHSLETKWHSLLQPEELEHYKMSFQ
eukprot:gene9476-10466_t